MPNETNQAFVTDAAQWEVLGFDDKLISLIQKAMPSLENWEHVGLGLSEDEMRLLKAAKAEGNWDAYRFILDHSGWARTVGKSAIGSR